MHGGRVDDLEPSQPPTGTVRTPRSALAGLRTTVLGSEARRTYGLLFLLFIVVLFAIPTSFGMGLTGNHGTPMAPMGHPIALTASTHRTAASVTHPSVTAIPGTDPSRQPYVDGAALTNTILNQQLSSPANWTKVASEIHGGGLVAPATTPAAAPHPAASYTCPTGTVIGTVKNNTGVNLQGVTVQSYSASGASSCPLQAIPPVTTNASGGFKVLAPVGADYLSFTDSFYLGNITYVQVYLATTTYLNYTVFMVQDGVLTGYVEANNSKHPGIGGVTVSAVARDQSQICVPEGTTSSNGYFQIGICPLPSFISFTPPYGYLSTFRYENATPGQHINIGIVYLETEPPVKVTLYNAVTHAPIPAGICNPFTMTQCNSIKVCSAATNVCLNQGNTLPTPTVTALAPKGFDYVVAEATGYVVNSVPIGWINQSTTIPPIYMVPLGAIGLSVMVTTNGTPWVNNWGTGLWVASACSMNGLQTAIGTVNPATYTVNTTTTQCTGLCAPVNRNFQAFGALPLRVDINIVPDTTGVCGGGIPQWPIPGLLPVWGNETYLNITTNSQTNSYLNLTPGNYVYGNATVSPGGAPLKGGFTTLGTSQDNPTLASYGWNSINGPWECRPYVQTATGFCTAVPPGPGEIRVSSLTQNYSDNYTWGSSPYICCMHSIEPMTLNRYTGGGENGGIGPASAGQTSINVTQLGSIHGHVFQGDTHVAVFFGSVKISAAGNHPQEPSFDGAVYLNGTFTAQAPLGWVSVQASASGYAPNTVWAWVNGSTNVGNISLTPLATLQGRLIDPTGHGIYEADVKYCRVDKPGQCTGLGAGLSTTDGQFNGTLLGGWLPWTTYEVQVTAAGFTSDWSWVNTTSGRTSILAPITLFPVGTNGSVGAVHRQTLSSLAAGVWIDGTILDRGHGEGIQTGGIQACPVDGSSCSQIHDGSNSQGYFNDSVAPGLYNLTVTAQGYFPASKFFNASQASYLHLGAIYLSPLAWINGTVNISPYGEITVRNGASTEQMMLAPGATAFACTSNGSVCGTALQISTQGRFFIQTGGGNYNRIQVTPNGGTVGPSVNGGFGSNVTVFNTTGPITNLSTNLSLPIYATIGGWVWDNSSTSPIGRTPWLPLRWAPVSLATFGPNHLATAWSTNGGGFYMFFVPAGPTQVVVASGLPPQATIPKNITVNLSQPLNTTIGSSMVILPQLNITHFGWIVFRLASSVDGRPAPYVGVSATANDPLNGTIASSGVSNAFGFVNMTAPPGKVVMVSIAATEDFNGTNFTTEVNRSATTWINGSHLWDLGNVGVEPFGWVRSQSLNNTTVPNLPTVVDSVNGLPIPLADVQVTSTVSTLSGSSLPTSWMGQFLSDAPPGLADNLIVAHWAYLPNTSKVAVTPGEVIVKSTVNLTGVGILAGQVLKYPGLTPIAFATVQTCPFNSTGFSDCFTTTTNDSGIYWVASYPGLVQLTVTANGFVSNSSAVARSCSDCWNWTPAVVLNEFSYVYGTVRALPSGLPIGLATVAACSPLGNPVGPCGFEVQSVPKGLPNVGQFLLAVPSGSYVLQANASGFNATYLPIYLVPGEILPVGILFLKQYGDATGTVLSSATLLPVSNASVFGCPLWAGGACTPTSMSDPSGQFDIAGPPGPYTIAVLANGYADSYSAATLVSGIHQSLQPIMITPLGVNVFYTLGGQVVNASDPGVGVAGAVVSATVNGTPAFSARTDGNGGFTMTVLWGDYVLSVIDPGYLPARQPVTVHGNVYGLLVSLQVMTFTVSGAISDGLTHQNLAGVTISEGNAVLAVTDVNGAYTLPLSNGSHSLTAAYAGGGIVAYAPVVFLVVVNGASVVHDLALVPQSVMIHGVVVDAVSGYALPGAVVQLRGTTVDGVPVTLTVTADPTGGFTASLYLGSYNASSAYTGYTPATVAFGVTPAGQSVPIPLHPEATVGGTLAPSGNSVQWLLAGCLGVVGLALVAIAPVVASRRRAERGAAAPARTVAPKPGAKAPVKATSKPPAPPRT